MPPLSPKAHVHLLDLIKCAFDTLRIFNSTMEDKVTNKIDANHSMC